MTTPITSKKPNFFIRNGLSIVFLMMAILALWGQTHTGLGEYNEFRSEYQQPPVSYLKYLSSGHFIQATFENWESEFLQMALFVLLTIYLRQQGSSESKDCDEPAFDRAELKPQKDSPWPVRKGGIYLVFYRNSLTIALFSLYLASFFLHWYGSWLDFNEQQVYEHKPTEGFFAYLDSSKLWFESFQNWQSEFLSVFAIIFLSVYLRQWGSSQSKPVNLPNKKADS